MKQNYDYINKFNRQKYDRIDIMLPKGKKEIIKEIAERNNESINNLVNRLLQKAMNMTDEEWKRNP